MRKGELLAANLQQLIAHAQVGDTQLRQIAREHDQRQVFRLVAQEETHGIVDHRVVNQMVVINDQIERTLPLAELNEKLREKGAEACVLALLHHVFAGLAMPARRLLDSRDQIAGKALLLVIALIQRIPAKIIHSCRPLWDERGLSIASRTGYQRQTIIVRAGKFRQQPIANHRVFETDWSTEFWRNQHS